MLTTERFPHANEDLEERVERDKTWLQWKLAYKKAHAQSRIKAQVNKGTVKFGATNSADLQETTINTETQQEVDDSGMKALEGYFDNLATAVVNKNTVLQELVLNNTKIARSNESLISLVKKLTGDIKNLERDNSCLKKGRASQRPEHNPLSPLQEIRLPSTGHKL